MGKHSINGNVKAVKGDFGVSHSEKHVFAPKPVNRQTRRAAKVINAKRKK
jgi:hypothetical protein